MKAIIKRASDHYHTSQVEMDITSLEQLLQIQKEDGNEWIISTGTDDHGTEYIKVLVYDDYV